MGFVHGPQPEGFGRGRPSLLTPAPRSVGPRPSAPAIRLLRRGLAAVTLALTLDRAGMAAAEPAPAGTMVSSATPGSQPLLNVGAASSPTRRLTAPLRHPAQAGVPAAPGGTELTAPVSLNDLSSWLDYKILNHIAALPQEARLFYRRGLLLWEAGAREQAVRLVRGASDLDPRFVAPHLTLASWFLLHEPGQALQQYGAVLELSRQNFVLQLALVANTLYLGLQALFIGVLAASFLVVWVRNRELRHAWHERLSQVLTPETSRWWSWAFLILPYAAGFGPILPTVFFLGLLWPSLRVRERLLFVMLVGLLGTGPWVALSLERMTTPLREDRGPLYGIPMVEPEPYSSELQARLQRLARLHPDNPFVLFGLAWVARHGNDLATAEDAYRRALAIRPQDDRIMNNLGNTLAMQGRLDESLDRYLRATAVNPSNAGAYFNASQIYTQRYEYRTASDALSRASALNFDLVKSYQSQATNDGLLPLADQWIAPRTFWQAVPHAVSGGTVPPSLPPAWRSRPECSSPLWSAVAVVIGVLGVWLGVWQQRSMPLRNCSNCGAVVCRRCAQRRRELALCPVCAAVESRAESPDFARVLLLQHGRAVSERQHLLRTALATLIPGYGLLAFRRLFTPLLLLTVTAALSSGWYGMQAPFSYEPRLSIFDSGAPLPILITMWVALYVVSLMGYFAQVARARVQAVAPTAPLRGRLAPPSRRITSAAA